MDTKLKSTVALIGNPNTGKTTLFNALTGLSQRTGNFAGVTVEKKIGTLKIGDRQIDLIDLPGTYSLSASSPDELVAIDVLLGRREEIDPPDLVIVVADASNLERNFYLVTQILEYDRSVILALNMHDLAISDGTQIDVDRLRRELNCEVVPIVANKRKGIDELRIAIKNTLDQKTSTDQFRVDLGKSVENGIGEIIEFSAERDLELHRAEGLRLLIDENGEIEHRTIDAFGPAFSEKLNQIRHEIEKSGVDLILIEPESRYNRIAKIIKTSVKFTDVKISITFADRVDRFLVHPIGGTLAFVGLMAIVFQAIYKWAGPLMDAIDGLFGSLGNLVSTVLPDGAIQSLIVDGVIAGVGGVAIFVPQIVILFGFIAILEDCGYMARAAFLMDRMMSWAGLSGRSFVPMMSSFACAIPGVMATRVIENRRDRFATILVAPLMSCSARLPVYTIMIATFIPQKTIFGFLGLQGLTLFAMYMIGMVVAIPVAWLLKKTILKGETPPFVMEMPSYKMPSASVIIMRMIDRGKRFLTTAGTVIFAITIVIWGLLYFPRPQSIADHYAQKASEIRSQNTTEDQLQELLNENDRAESGAYLRQSILGRAGKLIEPTVKPLGWDWKIGIAAIASFPAREVIVATLGIIYNLGGEEDETSESLRSVLKSATWDDEPDRKVFTPSVALSIMVFFALCAQCAATLVVIKRETGSWKWSAFTFGYMTTLAYFASLLTFQIGTRLGF